MRRRLWPTLFRWPIPWLDEEMEEFFAPTFSFRSIQDYKMNVEERDKEYVVTIETPGFRPDEIEVSFQEGVLVVSGKKSEEKKVEEKKKNYIRLERSSMEFTRQWTPPAEVDEANIKASMKDGLLTIVLPKSEKVKPKTIPVKIEEEK